MAGCNSTFCDTVVVTNANAMGGCTALFTPYDSAGYGFFYNQSTAVGSITSTWDFGDGSTGTSVGDIIHQYAASGTYNVCLTINDAVNSCTDTYCTTITIGQGGGASCNAYFSASTNGSVASFTDLSSGSPMNYFWDFGDGSTSAAMGSTSHTYSLNGSYYVCLTIGDTTSGCSDTYCGYVTVGNPAGNNCSANFYLVQDSTNMYNYTAVSYASTGALYSYFWDFGDGSSSTLQYPSHTYAGVGPYVLCLTVTDNVGCTATTLERRVRHHVRDCVPLPERGQADGARPDDEFCGVQVARRAEAVGCLGANCDGRCCGRECCGAGRQRCCCCVF
jgi:PKD repeat protein